MRVDRGAFLSGVLHHRAFQRDGLLFGREPFGVVGLHWVVVDPCRHALYVWRKRSPSYPSSALELGASVFTNGPFGTYAGGTLLRSTTKLALDAGPCMVRAAAHSPGGDEAVVPAEVRGGAGPVERLRAEWEAAKVRRYQAPTPLGFVVGVHEGIVETTTSRPRLHYFGRRDALSFEDYEISQGDPEGMTEVIGGLFRRVSGYEPSRASQFIRAGVWGLAPLVEDAALRDNGIEEARDAYRAGSVAHGAPELDCRGVIVAVAAWANTRRLAELLSGIRVKDAVQFDGGDSLLLGAGRIVRIGGWMPEWKRILQCWGFQFQRREALADAE